MTKYLQNIFNRPDYATELIPYDLSHFIQCLDYVQNRYQKRIHGRHVIRIFTHKLRAAPFIADKALLTMLDEAFPIMKRLRTACTRFLEIAVGKLSWVAEDGIKTWHSAKDIADKLTNMSAAKIVDSDDLYELLDTLFERYYFFVDAAKNLLPSSFFSELKYTVAEENTPLLDDDELELCLETRRQRFNHLLYECEFKMHAHYQGFVVS